MYFSKFPVTLYSLDDRETAQLVRNIFLRIAFNDEIKNNYSLYDEYDIKDGETPEILAHRMYGSTQYHWIILHLNDIIDPRFDWPMSTRDLIAYCEGKYENVYDTHHLEDSLGNWISNELFYLPETTFISNFSYEESINESKRRIKLLKPQYVEAVKKEFNNQIESVNG